jgi:hypothetical protein
VEELVHELRQVRVQQPDGSFQTKDGPYVEPVQLQVSCRSLWEARKDPRLITRADLAALGRGKGGGVDNVLAAYYAERVSEAAKKGQVAERLIRNWFGKQLITAQGVRRPVLVNEAHDFGLSPSCLQVLDKAFLIRREDRSGAQWYELAHDRLITPVLKDNEAWRSGHLNTFQVQAEVWAGLGQPRELLVAGGVLEEGERWAQDHAGELTDAEKAYLQACQDARDRANQKRERQMLRLMRYGVLAGTAVILILAVLAVVAIRSALRAKEAETAAEEAEKETKKAKAVAEKRGDDDAKNFRLARQLALRVVDDHKKISGDPRLWEYNLQDVLETSLQACAEF